MNHITTQKMLKILAKKRIKNGLSKLIIWKKMIGTRGAKQMIGESENLFYAHKVMVLCTQMHPFDDQ
ncbi:hypothetical protein HMPREF1254_1346 [Prevotella sp. BV3P1]|uniref:hypothetical protein n=1 Tax=Hoylesella buccalis TaxID=28127 RepID=UPI0003B876E4|nr:hypothetical protein [Hoylesella buccalis]ERT62137.1 hypothetical protein HMPREF1254_1346 [Prevotella sp. BV3P1]KGF41649.1 hypothetical protein HMPREF2140_03210 [Hoylesella buccalis DNF00985]